MNVGSLFSGIGGLDLGLHRAGWRHVFLCEGGGDPNGTLEERQQWNQGCYRRQVLRARFPGVPIYDDVVRVGEPAGRSPADAVCEAAHVGRREAGSGLSVDLLCGGFPCQDLSVAGRRAGLDGARSGLFFEFARIADTLRPRLLLVENVPGLLSSNGGRDFGIVLGTLADIGYGLAWRILDSRFFGVPQRRRRVFIVGVLADGDPAGAAECAGEILAVGQGCDRHSAKGGEAGQDVAGTLGARTSGSGRTTDLDGHGAYVPALTSRAGNTQDDQQLGQLVPHYYVEDFEDGTLTSSTGRIDRHPLLAHSLTSESHGSNPNSNMARRRREDDENLVIDSAPRAASSLRDGARLSGETDSSRGAENTGVRRLIPVECERLQALPDGWTEVPKGAPDSRRYAALGDAVTASVAEWIGRRLAAHLNAGRMAEDMQPTKGTGSFAR